MRAVLVRAMKGVPGLHDAAVAARHAAVVAQHAASGRALVRRYLDEASERRLQIGAGPNALVGWLNTDWTPREGVAFVDVRRPLPFDDQTFDVVFSEHLIEHVDYPDGARFLAECRRILRPGGRVRVATPDLDFVLSLRDGGDEALVRYIRYAVDTWMPDIGIARPAFVINNYFRNWGHRFIYDEPTLREAMERAGFRDLVRKAPGQSDDPRLIGIEAHGTQIPEEFNRMETMVLEGGR
jgi:SAM-dependent methyltransferase